MYERLLFFRYVLLKSRNYYLHLCQNLVYVVSFFVLTIRDGPKKENRPHQPKTSTKIDLYSFSPAEFV